MNVGVPRIPTYATSSLLGGLGQFRSSRVEFQRAAMREHPDICRTRFGIFDVLLIGSPRLVQALLVTRADDFVKSYGLSLFARPVLGDGLLTSEHALHRRQRRLIAPQFTKRQVGNYARTMAERADAALDRMLQLGTVEITAQTMQVTLEIVGKTLFDSELGGAAGEVGEAVTEAMQCIVGNMASALPLPPFVPSRLNLRLLRARRRLDRLVFRLIAEARRRPPGGNDLLAALLSARDEQGEPMSDRQVRDEVMTAVLAGHETTANALAWTLIVLARHAEERTLIEAELDAVLAGRPAEASDLPRLPRLLAAFKEALRLYPPVYLMSRRAVRDSDLCGYPVRKGQVVLVGTYGMHHRADLFSNPESFQPSRVLADKKKRLRGEGAPAAFLPFGAGARTCIGNHFALLEGQLLLARWLLRARFELSPKEQSIALEPLITLRPKAPVHMHVSAR